MSISIMKNRILFKKLREWIQKLIMKKSKFEMIISQVISFENTRFVINVGVKKLFTKENRNDNQKKKITNVLF